MGVPSGMINVSYLEDKQVREPGIRDWLGARLTLGVFYPYFPCFICIFVSNFDRMLLARHPSEVLRPIEQI